MMRGGLGLLAFLLSAPCWATDMNVLLWRCAPEVHPITMAAIVRLESGGHYLAIGDDGDFNLPREKRVQRSIFPASKEDAIKIAYELDAKGHVFGVGLGQVTNLNLKRMGMSFATAFEPCWNLKASRDILLENYKAAIPLHGEGQKALEAAISRYNTGSFVNGHKNGYVAKVVKSSRSALPVLKGGNGVRRVVASGQRGGGVGALGGEVKTRKMLLAEALASSAEVKGF